jgi:hypothetical protein
MRLLVELAPCEAPDELRQPIAETARKRLLDPQRVEPTLGRYADAPSSGALFAPQRCLKLPSTAITGA